jgi:hypothetical protein
MIKVQAKDPNGKLKWIQIARGEGDNGNIAIIGKSGGAPELSYDLLDIRRRSQTEFVCKADGPGWIDPEISCRIDPGTEEDTFEIHIDAGWAFKGSYVISAADCSALVHFMNTPPFPKA